MRNVLVEKSMVRAWIVVLICAVSITAAAGADSDFATEVVSFSGPFGPSPYDDPNAVLGKPSTEVYDPGMPPFIPAGVFTPSLAYAAWHTDTAGNKLVTTLNVGAEIVVKFDHEVLDHPGNWYGRDLIVYGNAFFLADATIYPDTDMAQPHIATGSVNYEPVTVSVSSDGQNWFTFGSEYRGDGFFPTNPFGWDLANDTWGSELDWTKPVDPTLTSLDFAGRSVAQAIGLYDGSAGGAGFDLMDLSATDYAQLDSVPVLLSSGLTIDCKYIQYVKVTSGDPVAGEVDGFSDVAVAPSYQPPLPGDLDGDGLVSGPDLDIVLADWGNSPPLDPRADPSGDGLVSGPDLDIVLTNWGRRIP